MGTRRRRRSSTGPPARPAPAGRSAGQAGGNGGGPPFDPSGAGVAAPGGGILALKPCRTCGEPIPWPLRKGYKGRLYPEAESSYRRRAYCAPACNPGAPRGSRTERERALVLEVERREAEALLRWLRTPQTALGPFDGHPCAVCGLPVRRGHPLHRDPRPDRSGPAVVRA